MFSLNASNIILQVKNCTEKLSSLQTDNVPAFILKVGLLNRHLDEAPALLLQSIEMDTDSQLSQSLACSSPRLQGI